MQYDELFSYLIVSTASVVLCLITTVAPFTNMV